MGCINRGFGATKMFGYFNKQLKEKPLLFSWEFGNPLNKILERFKYIHDDEL